MAKSIEPSELEVIEAFRGIDPTSFDAICKFAQKRTLKKGEILFLEKDKINKFYAVIHGKVSMYRLATNGQKRVFFLLDDGSLVNEVVFDDLPVSVVCEAFEKTEIVAFDKSDFLNIMEKDFRLTMNILNAIGRKQRRLYRQLKNTLPIGMEKRLAAKLWKLSKDHGVQDGDWKYIDMNLSCTYLSYMLGTSRESISRAMKVLTEIEAVKWVERQLFVKQDRLLIYYRYEE